MAPPTTTANSKNVAGLYRAFAPTLERILAAKGASPDDARDAVQDAFEALMVHEVDDERDLHGWLVTVARNALRDRERRQRTRSESSSNPILAPEPRGAPERELDARRLVGRVVALIAELPQARREALLACRVDGSSSEETAASIAASSAGNVRQQVHRALKTI